MGIFSQQQRLSCKMEWQLGLGWTLSTTLEKGLCRSCCVVKAFQRVLGGVGYVTNPQASGFKGFWGTARMNVVCFMSMTCFMAPP